MGSSNGSGERDPEVESAFHELLERRREGEVDLEAFLAALDERVRAGLERLLDDWEFLRESLTELPALAPGSVIGDFRLVGELGRGAMSVVWEARQESLDRPVALKLLTPLQALSEEATARFENEAKALARIAHPNIVQVFEVGEHDGTHFIAQDLVPDGYTLDDWISDTRTAREDSARHFRDVARLILAIAEAMAAAHAVGVVHRDLKPTNILIAPGPTPRVADFGLARIGVGEGISRTGERIGTLSYMSPEQVDGERDLDARTDVFSLGASLYEALTLRRAFGGESTAELCRKITTEDPPEVRSLVPRAPAELAAICQKALEKRRDDRYPSMAALADDLRAFLEDRPVSARPPGVPRRAQKWARRHPLRATFGSLVVAVIAASAITQLGSIVAAVRASNGAWKSGDLERLRDAVRDVPRPLGGLLPEDLRPLARRLRTLEGDEPLVQVLRVLAEEGRIPARVLAARFLERDGLGSHPTLAAFLEHGLHAEPGKERSSAILLCARLFHERPDASPQDVADSRAICDTLAGLFETEPPGIDRLYMLTAFSGCGTPETARLIVDGMRRCPADSTWTAEELRLSLVALKFLIMRSQTCGFLGESFDPEAVVVDATRALLDLVDSSEIDSGQSGALLVVTTAAAYASRAAGLQVGRIPPELDLYASDVRVRAARADEALHAQLEHSPFDAVHPSPLERHELQHYWQYGFVAGAYEDLARDDGLVLHVQRDAAERALAVEAAVETFQGGRREGANARAGLCPTCAPDVETHLGSWFVEAARPPVLHRLAEQKDADDALAIVAFSRGRVLASRAVRAVRTRSAQVEDAELSPVASFAKLGIAGLSELEVEFETGPQVPEASTLVLVVELQRGIRSLLPYRGAPALSVSLDDVLIVDKYVVHTNEALEGRNALLGFDRLRPGLHRVTLRLHPDSDTTLRISSVRLVAE